MSNSARSPLLSIVLVFAIGSCTPKAETFASAGRIERLDQQVGGPKSLAGVGDFLLQNDRIRVAVLGAMNADGTPRHSPGPHTRAGSLIDADLALPDPRWQSGRGSDQFAELIPTANMDVTNTQLSADSVRVLADGSDGGAAIIRVEGPKEPFLELLGALWAITRAPEFYMTTDYILEPGVPWVKIKTLYEYGPDAPLETAVEEPMGYFDSDLPLLEWALENGVVGGDFYLSGGSVDVFAPGIGFDEDGAVAVAENTFQRPFQFPFVAGTADGISYGIAPVQGNAFVPLFTSSQTVVVGAGRAGDGTQERFPAGSSFSYERYFFIGHGDIASIYDQYIEARGLPFGTLKGNVVEANTGTPLSDASVFVYAPGAEAPISQFGTDVHPLDDVPDGSFGGKLPPGNYELVAHKDGRPFGDRVPVVVVEGEEIAFTLTAGQAGALRFSVTDETGRNVPAKVTVVRTDSAAERDPLRGDGFIGGSPASVAFAMYGQGSVELPPGEYVAIASRGPEYEIDRSEPFTIDARQGARVDLQVLRSINTDGWISADLHVHGVASHDSNISRAQRIETMVAEGVEFFASTDHDFIVDYAPVVEELELTEWVQTAVGVEVTTIEVGHFLGFPLGIDHLEEAGGALDWVGKRPQEMLDGIRSRGEMVGYDPVTFIGHPRDGILGYFDQYGFDPYGGTPGRAGEPGTPLILRPVLGLTNPLLTPNALSWDFDGLEMLNGKRFELLRTATASEVIDFGQGNVRDYQVEAVYGMMTRTMEEQQGLIDGTYTLTPEMHGQVDDWFALLNLGYKFTVLGNSDTHGTTGIEAGCPRNYVMSETDDPAFLDDQAIADAVKAHKVVASYGPFVQMWANGATIGSEITGEGPIEIEIDVQAPTWMGVDRVELYENGTLIQEWSVDAAPVTDRFQATHTVTPTQDSWYVVTVASDDDMQPVVTPVEIPYVELQVVVTEALSGVSGIGGLVSPAAPLPRVFPALPYAVTNPIWVDLAGDGFDAPGHPDWWVRP